MAANCIRDLIRALQLRNVEALREIVQSGSSVNGTDDNEHTALCTAVTLDFEDGFHILLNAGADVNETSKLGTPLQLAIKNNHAKFVEDLLNAGADVNYCRSYQPSPLMCAAAERNIDMVALLIDSGADTNYVDAMGYSSLCSALAVKEPNNPCVDFLLQSGACVNKGDEMFPLLLACRLGLDKYVVSLIDAGADVNKISTITCTSALMEASSQGHLLCVQNLLSRGADVNAICLTTCQTPLHITCRWLQHHCVDCLIKAGCNVNAVDGFGNTCLTLAIDACHRQPSWAPRLYETLYQVCLTLLQAGAKVNISKKFPLDEMKSWPTMEKVATLMYVAGEKIRQPLPNYIRALKGCDTDNRLLFICREEIRRELLQRSSINLLCRVYLLGLPKRLANFLLYDREDCLT